MNAYQSDPVSAFGGIVACNFKINKLIAKEMNKIFFEVILAKGFNKDAIKVLKKKKQLRIIDISKYKDKNKIFAKFFNGAFLIQDKDEIIYNKKNLRVVTKIKPSKKK